MMDVTTSILFWRSHSCLAFDDLRWSLDGLTVGSMDLKTDLFVLAFITLSTMSLLVPVDDTFLYLQILTNFALGNCSNFLLNFLVSNDQWMKVAIFSAKLPFFLVKQFANRFSMEYYVDTT